MRRPAQQPHSPTARTAWAHPYRGAFALGVFYNSGGTEPPAPAAAPPAPQGGAPSPADLAARTAQQPPATTPRPANPDDVVLLDHGTGEPMTQGAFSKIMAREHAKGRRAALRELAEAAGVPFTHDDFDVTQFGKMFKDAEQARQARLTEEQRRQEELERREQELNSSRTSLEQQQAELAEARRTIAREQALTRLGAVDILDDQGQVTAPHLQDALALLDRELRDTPDADPEAVAAAAAKIKARHAGLFGAAPAPQTLPPAPSGGPAAGNAPHPAVTGGKDAVKEEARKWADRLGYGSSSAA